MSSCKLVSVTVLHAYAAVDIHTHNALSKTTTTIILSAVGAVVCLGLSKFFLDFMVYWTFRRNRRQKYGETSFSPFCVFLFSRNSRVRFLGLILWLLRVGRAQHPGPVYLSVCRY